MALPAFVHTAAASSTCPRGREGGRGEGGGKREKASASSAEERRRKVVGGVVLGPGPPLPPPAPLGAPARGGGEKKAAAAASRVASQRRFSENDVEDEDDDEDSSETDSEDDDEDEEHGAPLEGAYNPAEYDCLPVSLEIKDLFQYIRRYSPQMIDLEHKLRPFIPDFIPAVGDIDAFLKVPRPDGKPDNLGLLVLDEPSTKQSDPTVLSLWLTENSKQHNVAQQIKVKSLENAEKNPKAIDSWVESISELHRCKPPASVHYARPMPDIDSLMQEWSPEFEELLGKVSLPTADISCSLAEYTDMICAILDIPVYKSRIQSLHTLFSLYSEFKNSQHFKAPAEGKKAASPPSNSALPTGETDHLSFPCSLSG
ncbi:PREDICTED: intraflagellar transport protein 46 homolog [Gekko japonicus]|uniref:Intraflagellar transport protein 46 homolog n=1 Tax=Gekko japonicus TaxID=146911 RepID=A0ABM1K633_GEKJA|nr:PREDICTED: intraflagellar transport protein 46 homolog [Gekko japonicus]